MKIIIVDDELSSRLNTRKMLEAYFPLVVICAEADKVENAFDLIQFYMPDLVLLDIDLPDGNAFDLLRKFDSISFNIIFITAFEKYALQAIKFSALDYLLKPFAAGEFIEAIQKAQTKLSLSEINIRFNALMQNFQSQNHPPKIVLRTAESIHVIPTAEIMRLQADGAYTTFYALNRKPITVSKNLKEYESTLEVNGFVRTHQSHLVNSRYIACFHKTNGGYLTLTDDTTVPVSVRFKEKLLAGIERNR